ncbi:hypothetical protein BDZ89DRAFT_1042905 [Hymenopellis radicata]|nr:hypothetical protein BDZ89DRAFT_1042905 [Hymenopellis radicata]
MPRLWTTQMTPEEREYEIAYRRAVLSLPSTAPQQDHPYPEFFTTSTYIISSVFTTEETAFLRESFTDFERGLRDNKIKAWFTRFFQRWDVLFPEAPENARKRHKSIIKLYINMLASYWTGDGRSAGKDGRMDVITVRFDILHELVDDFAYLFVEATQ